MSQFKWTKEHLLAGNCVFTVIDGNGDHMVFRVLLSKPVYKNPSDKSQGLKYPQKYFVSRQTGSSNTKDYTRFGILDPETGIVRLNSVTNWTYETVCVKVADLVIGRIFAGDALPEGLRMDPPSACCKCGKMLTVPVEGNPYRAYGYGPDCGPRVMGELLPNSTPADAPYGEYDLEPGDDDSGLDPLDYTADN